MKKILLKKFVIGSLFAFFVVVPNKVVAIRNGCGALTNATGAPGGGYCQLNNGEKINAGGTQCGIGSDLCCSNEGGLSSERCVLNEAVEPANTQNECGALTNPTGAPGGGYCQLNNGEKINAGGTQCGIGSDLCCSSKIACAQYKMEIATKNGDSQKFVFELCSQVSDPTAKNQCGDCSKKSGVWTAIGCIPTDSNGILTAFVRLALSMGGGIVLLMTLAAAFQLTTSKGDP